MKIKEASVLYKCLFLMGALVFFSPVKAEESLVDQRLKQIIGDIIVRYDAEYVECGDIYAFGSGPISSVYHDYYYKEVEKMPQSQRFSYFWFGLWHLGLQGGGMNLLADLVMDDPAVETYKLELRDFIRKGVEGGRQERRTAYAKALLHFLEVR